MEIITVAVLRKTIHSCDTKGQGWMGSYRSLGPHHTPHFTDGKTEVLRAKRKLKVTDSPLPRNHVLWQDAVFPA